MKKFGTPSGAGPGTENEKVGFDDVGTPFLAVGAGGLDGCEVVVEGLGPVGPVGWLPLFPVGPVVPGVRGPVGPLVPLCLPPEPL